MKNWKTTIGGILLAIGAAAQGAPLPENYKWIPNVLIAIGGGLLGLSAKDRDVHSTVAQVEKATVKEIQEELKK